MMNKFLLRLPLFYSVITILIVIISWLGNYYGFDIRNILSAEGLRWFVENLIPNMALSPLAEIVFLLMAISVVVESGLLKVFSGNLSPKQRRALQLTGALFLFYCLLLVVLVFFSSSILLSALGTISGSPLSRGVLGLIVISLLMIGNFYGFVSGRLVTVNDFIQAHCELIRRVSPFFITIIIASQLVAFVDYAFGDGSLVNLELLSFFIYYVPLFLHLACGIKRE